MHEIEETEGLGGFLALLWRTGHDYDDDQYDVLDNTIDEKPVAEQAEQVSGGCGGAGGEPPKKHFKLLNRSYGVIDLTAD